MDRRTVLLSGAAALGTAGLAKAQPAVNPPDAAPRQLPPVRTQSVAATPTPKPVVEDATPAEPAPAEAAPAAAAEETPAAADKGFTREEIQANVSDFLGVTAEAAGGLVERLFAKNGKPTAYIAGEEGSGAFVVGGRYGRGLLYMKDAEPVEVFWQGPSVGWDFGGNASRVFTLCYDLEDAKDIYQRFPGVEGSAYMVGGVGVNFQKANGITLAPIRAGVGVRLGANVGYLAYSKKRNIIPF
ncbi:DUF1134 domain-containing protein [Phenylobacterium sp.]|jgi:hypothetical protein|uniref:DUF1134 domain-containing protein n=1 Tax=Phenylobacterium sp. TaxID=1871053 RepID=UPI002F957027